MISTLLALAISGLNLEEVDKFLEMYNPPKPNQEGTETITFN